MITLLLDTHAAIWLFQADPRLSARVAQEIAAITQQPSAQAAISSISLVEIAYLEEKGRVSTGTLQGFLAFIDQPESVVVEVPVNREILSSLLAIPRSSVPDLPDRIIAATALHLGVPLASRDRKIQSSQIRTIW
jgi:PIN domain nuclease of toxin-antitoxin system